MTEMLENPVLWVTVAFVLFVGLSYRKISALLLKALDERSARIKQELDQARSLREEAERVLKEYQKKQAEYLKEAEAMLEAARRDAEGLRHSAERELRAAMDERLRHAVDRIAQEEEKAVQDVRNHIVDISLAAAKSIIAGYVGVLPPDELVKLALADVGRKIH